MEESAAEEDRKRSITLFCPSVSKFFHIIESEDRRLDLGFIARVFGLDPNTLKLNGHFISRGLDFVASSVTWKSLIGYFSARGLSTGDSDALLVHGKQLSTNDGTKNGILATDQQGYVSNTKRLKTSGPADLSIQTAWFKPNASGLKRKLCLEDDIHLKRSRTYEAFPSMLHLLAYISPDTVSKIKKRMRVEEEVATTPTKKIR